MKKIKVMIVDDSAVVRQTLSDIISADPALEVMCTAQDPYIAVEKLKNQIPDVITLDIEMPRMDGVTFLSKLMSQHPLPVIICSSLVGDGSETTMKALEAGALDIIQKPRMGTKRFLEESHLLITDAIKAAAQAKTKKIIVTKKKVTKKLTADAVLKKSSSRAMVETTEKVIMVGASTGGTEAIRSLLENMPLDCPGILVVLHMPEGFTKSYADRINSLSSIHVREAKDGDTVLNGQALIAPGNKHLLLKRSGARYYVQIKDGPLVSRHRPSVDVLFRSAARYAAKNAVGAILTGMGSDGAEGMKEMFEAGAWTCAQDEASSVVYGMPKEAVAKGGVCKEIALDKMAPALIRACNRKNG